MEFSVLAEQLEDSFIPENAIGMDAILQLQIDGEEIENWLMEIHQSKCTIRPGLCADPRVTVRISSNDLQALLSRQLDPMRAFFMGKVQVHGDKGFLMKLPTIFSTQKLEQ